MTIAVKISVSGIDLAKFSNRMNSNSPMEVGNSLFKYATHLSTQLRNEALNDNLRPVTPDRKSASFRIRAKRLSKNNSVVMMPRSLVLLDSMKPHYVSLKRGRNISKWTKKYYGSAKVTGRSKVIRGPRGGLKGAIYVYPHRFVQKTLNRERNRLPNELRKSVKKAYKASASFAVGGVKL